MTSETPSGIPPQPPAYPQQPPAPQQQPPAYSMPTSGVQAGPWPGQVPVPPPVPQPSVGTIVLGGFIVLAGAGILALPYLLFLVGGGGDTERFDDFARSFAVTAAVVVIVGLAVAALGIIRAVKTGQRLRDQGVSVVPGRILGAVAFVLAFPVSVLGLILGYVARARSAKAGASNGLAVGAIVIGWIVTGCTALFWVFVLVASIAVSLQYG